MRRLVICWRFSEAPAASAAQQVPNPLWLAIEELMRLCASLDAALVPVPVVWLVWRFAGEMDLRS
jgi:hypothetical protein